MPDILHTVYFTRLASMNRNVSTVACLLVALLLMTAAPQARAQGAPPTPPGLGVELNSATDLSGSCRLTFVADNATGAAIEDLQLEMAVFDAGGAARLVTFEFGALRDGRLRVVQFDLPEQGCAAVSLLHVNKVAVCELADQAEGTDGDLCDTELRLSSRVGAITLRM